MVRTRSTALSQPGRSSVPEQLVSNQRGDSGVHARRSAKTESAPTDTGDAVACIFMSDRLYKLLRQATADQLMPDGR